MSSSPILSRQNSPVALRSARAFRRRYRTAKLWHAARLGGGVSIAVVGVLLALVERSTSNYVAAVAAAWVVLSRMVFTVREKEAQRQGAQAQEVFDTVAFTLPWRDSLVGAPPATEDLRDWGRRQKEDGLRDWYSDAPAQHPLDVLITQRATLQWAGRDHRDYARVVRGAALLVLGATVVIAVVSNMEVGEYLLRLGLPVMPAVLDMLDVANRNKHLSETRGALAARADGLYQRARVTGHPPTSGEVRDLQDGLYVSRCSMGVPGWLYRLTRKRRQGNMEQVTFEQARALPAALRR